MKKTPIPEGFKATFQTLKAVGREISRLADLRSELFVRLRQLDDSEGAAESESELESELESVSRRLEQAHLEYERILKLLEQDIRATMAPEAHAPLTTMEAPCASASVVAMTHIVLIAASCVESGALRGSEPHGDHDELATELLRAVARNDLELWLGSGQEGWYRRVCNEHLGALLTRTGELEPGTTLISLISRWTPSPLDLARTTQSLIGALASVWGSAAAEQIAQSTLSSHRTAAMSRATLQEARELRRSAHIFFPLSDSSGLRALELCALVRDEVPWVTLGLDDSSLPHHRWAATDPRTLLACGAMLELLLVLGSGRAHLKVAENFGSFDIQGKGREVTVDTGHPWYSDWRISRDSQERPLPDFIPELIDRARLTPETRGPSRSWVLSVLEDKPFVWAELAEQIDVQIAQRDDIRPSWYARWIRRLRS